MNRYPFIETKVHELLSAIYLEPLKTHAYIHLHGCVQMITMLAIERHLNVELARIAAILHDISTYVENCSHTVHAIQSAAYAKKLLIQTSLFDEEEINCITTMITRHSLKDIVDDEMCELLKDADALTSYYTNLEIHHERLYSLLQQKIN